MMQEDSFVGEEPLKNEPTNESRSLFWDSEEFELACLHLGTARRGTCDDRAKNRTFLTYSKKLWCESYTRAGM
jgi:hypothetical protein